MLTVTSVTSVRYVVCTRAGEVMVCVLDFKRDVGLWHGILTVSPSVFLLLYTLSTCCTVH